MMQGEVVVTIEKKATGERWSKGGRLINFGSRAEAERQIEKWTKHADGLSREDYEIHVDRTTY